MSAGDPLPERIRGRSPSVPAGAAVPMRLLLCIHSLGGGGAERVAANLANYWTGLGRDITLVTQTSTREDRYRLDAAVTRISLEAAAPSSGLPLAIVANLRRILALRRVLRTERPEVVIAMMSTMNVLLAIAGLGIGPMLMIGCERYHPPRLPLSRAWMWLRARTYRWLDAVVVLSGETRAWVMAHTSARRVSVIPNPVVWPLTLHEPLRDPNSIGRPARKRLLAVGRLGHQKGFDLLIEVFDRLAMRDWELVIVGEGPDRGALESRIAALGLVDAVHLPGEVGNLGEWYQGADLFVLSSRFEGFPNALVEAMSHGLPVVAFDCETGPREIIRPGVDGMLVAPGDAGALEGALRQMMGDAALRARYGIRAAEVRSRFSMEHVAHLWDELMGALVHTPRGASVPGPAIPPDAGA
jgi:glycosyltransferase involved in cell wall biosynthesis